MSLQAGPTSVSTGSASSFSEEDPAAGSSSQPAVQDRHASDSSHSASPSSEGPSAAGSTSQPAVQNRPAEPFSSNSSHEVPQSAAPLIHPANTHAMTTRAKSGIVKPRLMPTLLLSELEPHTAKQAMKHPHWLQAMKQ